MRQGRSGNGSRDKNLVGIITYQIWYYYLPDMLSLPTRSGVITFQIWYYYLADLVLLSTRSGITVKQCWPCVSFLWHLSFPTQASFPGGRIVRQSSGSFFPSSFLPSSFSSPPPSSKSRFCASSTAATSYFGDIWIYLCYYEDFPLIPTKVRSMESTNMGKFKNPLRNLNVIYVMIIAIFTALQLMVT